MNTENCKYLKILCGICFRELLFKNTFTNIVKLSFFVINIEFQDLLLFQNLHFVRNIDISQKKFLTVFWRIYILWFLKAAKLCSCMKIMVFKLLPRQRKCLRSKVQGMLTGLEVPHNSSPRAALEIPVWSILYVILLHNIWFQKPLAQIWWLFSLLISNSLFS